MANLSKELRKIFFTTLERKAEESKRRTTPTYGGYCGGMMPPVTHRPTTYQPSLFQGDNGAMCCIYFYEWSDTKRIPKTYYTLKAFENFLNDCHIYLASWQREVLTHMKHPYIACKKGGRDIVIKSNYMELTKAIEEGSNSSSLPFNNNGSRDEEPYAVAITRPPRQRHMQEVFEPEGRWFG